MLYFCKRAVPLFLAACFTATALLPSPLVPYALAQTIDCSIADSSIELASKIRGLAVKKPVPCKIQNKEEVTQYLKDTIKTKVPKKRLQSEESIYKFLGILPEDYDYESGIVKLYTSQLGGYYDADKDYYAMAAWMPAMMQVPIAVHELIHALQDQHFTIDKLLDNTTVTSDTLLARSAVLEGDATAVMIDYTLGLQGGARLENQESVSGFLLQNISSALLSSGTTDAPQALYAMLIFPYVSGLNFVHSHLKNGGYKQVDKLYSRLPRTTEEILHPEVYLSGEKSFSEVEVSKYKKGIPGVSDEAVFTDRLGEFFISTMLSSQIGPAVAGEAARGWGGDNIALYSINASSKDFMVWGTAWDSKSDAVEFFKAMSEAFKKRFKANPVETAKMTSFVTKSFGSVKIMLEGSEVILTMGG